MVAAVGFGTYSLALSRVLHQAMTFRAVGSKTHLLRFVASVCISSFIARALLNAFFLWPHFLRLFTDNYAMSVLIEYSIVEIFPMVVILTSLLVRARAEQPREQLSTALVPDSSPSVSIVG
mmetsp:Transcript_26667/g.63430  ORF Transcript_26667/g.63430 Transcript_26667/m.63430 type:complete len:121 (+) Transcript_26667:549-911(+)